MQTIFLTDVPCTNGHLIQVYTVVLPFSQYDSGHFNFMLGNFPNVRVCYHLVTDGAFCSLKSPLYSSPIVRLNNLEPTMLVIRPGEAALNSSF